MPLPSSSHSASTSEASHLPGSEEALMKVQMSEKLEKLNSVPEKKSTLVGNHSESKNATSARRNVNKWDHPSSPGSKVAHSNAQLATGNATSTSRSASPKKMSNSTSRGHQQAPCVSPKKGESKNTHRGCLDQPESPRKRESQLPRTSDSAVFLKSPTQEKKGRSASPQKHPKKEKNKDKLNMEQGLLACQKRIHADDNDTSGLRKDDKVKLGVMRDGPKQNISGKDEKCPSETAHTKSEEQSLPLLKTNKLRKNPLEDKEIETSSPFKMAGLPSDSPLSEEQNSRLVAKEPVVLDKLRNSDLEPADKTKENGIYKCESGSPVKKTLSPGPWKVPSASRVTKATGVTDKRV